MAFKGENKTGKSPGSLSAVVKRLFTPAAAAAERPLARRHRPGSPEPPPAPTGIPLGAIPAFPESPRGGKSGPGASNAAGSGAAHPERVSPGREVALCPREEEVTPRCPPRSRGIPGSPRLLRPGRKRGRGLGLARGPRAVSPNHPAALIPSPPGLGGLSPGCSPRENSWKRDWRSFPRPGSTGAEFAGPRGVSS